MALVLSAGPTKLIRIPSAKVLDQSGYLFGNPVANVSQDRYLVLTWISRVVRTFGIKTTLTKHQLIGGF